MTQPTSVIYLPPGVVPAAPPPAAHNGVPFDRQFFEAILPRAVQSFCGQVPCDSPRVELYTIDGSTHYINGISGVTDLWVALQTSREEHDNTVQVFVPYQTIYRVEIHPQSDGARRRLGFIGPTAEQAPPPAVQPKHEAAALKSGSAKAKK